MDLSRLRSRGLPHLGMIGYGVMLACVFAFFRDYGVTWDETVEFSLRHKGPRTWNFWFGGFSASDAPFDTGHNPLVHGLYYAVWRALGALGSTMPIHDVYHLLTGLIATLGVVLTYRLARLVTTRNGALLAAAVLALTPRYLGHAFGNFKDIPFAVAWLGCLLTLISAVRRPSLRNIALHGVAVGALLICRIGGLLFVPVSLLGLVLCWRTPQCPKIGALAARTIVAATIAASLHYLSYPYLLLHPLSGMVELFETQRAFSWSGHTLTFGTMLAAVDTPRWYAPAWLVVTTPEFTLLGLGLAAFFAGRRRLLPADSPSRLALLLIATGALLPLGYVIVARAPIYDGIRHILFVIPLLTILATAGWTKAVASLPRFVAPVAAVSILAIMAAQVIALHPFQYIGFNSMVGGPAGAQATFTLDYWAASSKQSAEWIAANGTHPKTVCVTTDLTRSWERYLPDEWTVEGHADARDCPYWSHYIYAFSRNELVHATRSALGPDTKNWRLEHTIERGGAVIGQIWKATRPVSPPNR